MNRTTKTARERRSAALMLKGEMPILPSRLAVITMHLAGFGCVIARNYPRDAISSEVVAFGGAVHVPGGPNDFGRPGPRT